MLVTGDDIRRAVSRNAFQAGLEYQLSGSVEVVSPSRDGSVLTARVRGTARAPYRQTIHLGATKGRVSIAGSCNCPVGFNCKHVAAALIVYQEQQLARPGGAKAEANAGRELNINHRATSVPDLLIRPRWS